MFNQEWREKGAPSETLLRVVVLAITMVALTAAIGLIGTVFVRGIGAISTEFVFGMPVNRGIEGGVFPALYGTFLLLVLTAIICVPIGVMAGIYLTEYARPGRMLALINGSILNLAGVPSIVYGLFGLAFFVLFLGLGSSLLAAALTLACMTLPVVVTATREALLSVPQAYREAAWALGATRWQTIYTVVLPAARNGITTGALLGLGRAAGETAPIIATGVAFVLPRLPVSPLDRFMALPYQIYVFATQIPEMPKERMWGAALLLLALVLTANVAATLLRRTTPAGRNH
jgi:phosphate transport system permease protein